MTPYKITFLRVIDPTALVLPVRTVSGFDRGVVVAEDAHTIQFNWAGAPSDTPVLVADKTDEGAAWVRGWLRWWHPRDRETKRSMLAAAAMGGGSIRVSEQEMKRQAAWWASTWDRLLGRVRPPAGPLTPC